MKSEVNVTIVYEQILNAINERNDDGTRKYKYIILEGSSRSSKTQSTIQIVHQQCSTNLNYRVSVWRDTKSDCVATIGFDVDRVFPELPNWNFITKNQTKHHYKFWTNSVFELNGSDDENKVIGFQGEVSWINEPYKMGKKTFDQLDMRTTEFVIIDWNPKQSHWVEDIKKDKRAITIHSTWKDNPFCPYEQKQKILSYQPVSMCDAVESAILSVDEAFDYDIIKNEKGLTQRQLKELSRCILNHDKNSASEFNWKVYGLGLKAELPNRIFRHFKKITKSQFDAIQSESYYGVDWGQVDPFGIIEVKYYDSTIYVHEHNYLSENEIKAGMTHEELANIINSEEGIVKYIFEKAKINKNAYIICDNNRPDKINALYYSGYSNALKANKKTIVDGINILSQLNVCYTQESINFDYEQENYLWKVDRYGIVVEEPQDKDNHLIDPLRYVVTFLKNQSIIKKI
jgi:hypothetical protein